MYSTTISLGEYDPAYDSYFQNGFSVVFLDPSPPVGVVQYGGYFRAQYGAGARQRGMYSNLPRYITLLELKK